MTHFVFKSVRNDENPLGNITCIYKGTREGAMNEFKQKMSALEEVAEGVTRSGFTSFAKDFDYSKHCGVMYFKACTKGSEITYYVGNNNDFKGVLVG